MTNHQKKAAALAAGIFLGSVIFILTLICYYSGSYAAAFLEVVRSIYVIYTINPNGAIIGLCLGFLDGFTSIYILLTIYQIVEKRIK